MLSAAHAARIASRSLANATAAVASGAAAQQQRGYKCCVLGMAGGVGEQLSQRLKLNPRVTELAGYDVGDDMHKALQGSDVVVIRDGVPRKPDMTHDERFTINAGILKNLVAGCADTCPKAVILVISKSLNSMVPIAAEVLKSKAVYDPRRLLGVTTSDVLRARTMISKAKGLNFAKVPVVGGHAGCTIVPLLSQTMPECTFTDLEKKELTHHINLQLRPRKSSLFADDTEVEAKEDGRGSAMLSMDFTAAHFVDRVMAGLAGEKGVIECAFVESSFSASPFFASPCTLGKNGVELVHDIAPDKFEEQLIADMIPDLIAQGEKGIQWARQNMFTREDEGRRAALLWAGRA